jgi:hypothetical protein
VLHALQNQQRREIRVQCALTSHPQNSGRGFWDSLSTLHPQAIHKKSTGTAKTVENSGAGNKTYALQEGTIGNGICLDSQGLVARQVQVSFQPDEASGRLFRAGGADRRSRLLSGEGCAGCQPFGAAHDAAYAAVFLLAMFERHGQPLEVLIRHFIQARFVRPRIRVWQNDNFYQTIERSIRNQQEVQKILRGKQRKNQADKG